MRIEIDHVTFCGSSLEELRKAFSDAGLVPEYGGPHANGVTHMDLLGFQDGSYLELIAPMSREAGSGMMAGWSQLMAADAGACAWAIRVANIQEEVNRLGAASIPVTAPESGGRSKIDGIALRWRTAAVGPGAAGALLPFMIQDDTSRELRIQPTQGIEASGLTGVGSVILGVLDLDVAIALFRSAYGWEAPVVAQDRAWAATLAHFTQTPVMLAAPRERESWLAMRLQRFGNCPVGFLLGTPDLEITSKRFRLVGTSTWFERKIAWFDQARLRGARLGVIQ